jgi:hypothetical protein
MPYNTAKAKRVRQQVKDAAPVVKIPGTTKGYGSGDQGSPQKGNKKA